MVRTNIVVPPLALPADMALPLGPAKSPVCIKLEQDVDAVGVPVDEAQLPGVAAKIDVLLKATSCTGLLKTNVEDKHDAYDIVCHSNNSTWPWGRSCA